MSEGTKNVPMEAKGMAMNETLREKLLLEYTEKHMGKVFYFCLRKTSDRYEAEDLTQDISLNVILALEKETLPDNFSAYVWRIARNRYSVWADKKRKKEEALSPCDIYEYEHEIADSDENILENMIRREELALLRRELAFISSDYRNIVVAYYLENRSIRDIATSLSLPEGTVKAKLFRARNILKEGMNMAREFGKRSYNPEDIDFVNFCSGFGDNGQPWSILTHALYKNIFLEAYDNPSTAEELALELGVALPYMEDELEFLTKETFLLKTGNKYETAFPIIGKEAQDEIHEYNLTIISDLTRLIEELIDGYANACSAHGIDFYGRYQSYEDAKWTLLIHTFDKLMAEAAGELNHKRTKRPSHGEWDILGYKKTERSYNGWVGRHGSITHKNVLNAETIDFVQFKFMYKGINSKTPPFLSYDESLTLKRLAEGKTEGLEETYLEKLVKYGYAKKSESGYTPAIVVFKGYDTSNTLEKFTDGEKEELKEKAAAIRNLLSSASVYAMNITKKDLPQSFKKDERMCSLACNNTKVEAGHLMHRALLDGWIKYDENTSKGMGAYLYI